MSALQTLSLWNIETELAELIELRAEIPAGEDVSAVDAQIAEYVGRSITKIDGLRDYLKHCSLMADAASAEAKAQKARAEAWEARAAYLKRYVADAMQHVGKKKLEGSRGVLALKGNGGKQPIEIARDARLVPDEFCEWEGVIGWELWRKLRDALVMGLRPALFRELDAAMNRKPNAEAIRAALARSCPICEGTGFLNGVAEGKCHECEGSGKQQVPGARLLERGKHVEVL